MAGAGSLLVLGNLMMDSVATVEDNYLENYNLSPDSIQMAGKCHLNIYQDILKRKDVVVSPGGSALNTIRMTQKILGISNSICLIGAVGSDETGKLLVKTVEQEGIKMLVQFVENAPTARCACLLTNGGSQRTMVTDLGAALRFSYETWMESEENHEWLEKAKFVYISGYFLKVSSKTAMSVAKKVGERGRNVPILLNLNAVWVTTTCSEEIRGLLPFIDVLFGNEAEITSFVRELGLKVDLNVAQTVSMLSSFILETKKGFAISTQAEPEVASTKLVIIMTRGELPLICCENGQSKEYEVPLVSKDDLLDSTGAGDAFVGGFLAQFIQNRSLDIAISCGIWAATEELKGNGFILPSEVPEQFK